MILNILERYNLLKEFKSFKDAIDWFNRLNKTQKENILSLRINPKLIEFDEKILIDENLLNKKDYLQRINEFMSIKNADGCIHLFDYMLNKDFLDSPKFYQDIETLKRCDTARYPLWIIGNKTFIDSPYHDEDFEILVTAKDTKRDCTFVIQENIAELAKCEASINSEHHQKDMQMIAERGSDCLQMTHSFPEHSIGYLSRNEVSLKDPYHRENMEILANMYDTDICGYLYRIMINEKAIKHKNYRKVIQDITDNSENDLLGLILCIYLTDYQEADKGMIHNSKYPFYRDELMKNYKYIDKMVKKVGLNYFLYGKLPKELIFEIKTKSFHIKDICERNNPLLPIQMLISNILEFNETKNQKEKKEEKKLTLK